MGVTIVTDEKQFSKEERAKLQHKVNTLMNKDQLPISKIMHRLGLDDQISVRLTEGSDGINMECRKYQPVEIA